MHIPFADSPRSTLGIEWELAFVDAASFDLVGLGPSVISAFLGTSTESVLSKELLENTIEIVTGVHRRVDTAVHEVSETLTSVQREARRRGAKLFSAGTHPSATPESQPVTPSARYNRLIDRTQWWGHQMLIYGVHVHVGVDAADKAFPIINGLLPYAGHLQALSAASPWWAGTPTGYASNRAMMFQQLPTAGLPYHFERWEQYEEYCGDLFATNVIEHANEIRWDVRPSSRFGTIELRICDGVPTVTEIAAIAALSQCLVESLNARLSSGTGVPTLKPWQVRENKWRAARYGMDAELIVDSNNREAPVAEDLVKTVDSLLPTARRLGCEAELSAIPELIGVGASYQRQRTVADRSGGDLREVVRALTEETDRQWLQGVSGSATRSAS